MLIRPQPAHTLGSWPLPITAANQLPTTLTDQDAGLAWEICGRWYVWVGDCYRIFSGGIETEGLCSG